MSGVGVRVSGSRAILGLGIDVTTTTTLDTPISWGTSKRFRRLRHAGRQLALAAADGLAFLTADLLIRWGRPVPALVFFPGTTFDRHALQIDAFLLLAVLFVAMRYMVGAYGRRLPFWDSARLTTRALLITSIPDFLLLTLADGLYSPLAIFGTWAFLIVAVPTSRQLARVIMDRLGLWRIPSALIGDGARAGVVYTALSSSLSLGFEIRTVISSQQGEPLPDSLAELNHVVVSNADEVVNRVLQYGCEQAVVATDDVHSEGFTNVVQKFLEADLTVAIIPSLRRLPLVGLDSSYFFGRDILLLQMRNNLRQWARRLLKRSFDFVGAALLLAVLAPLFAAIAFAIKRYDGGPVFFRHTRIGRGRTRFGCMKFRTMAVDADDRLARWRSENPALYEEFLKTFKLRDDPRVTSPGKWLRRTSLDELPQLINVLRGEMSLVGPRPVVEKELHDYYGSAAQLYCRVRPGMTGLWQVSGRSDTSYEERITYDELYILNWTFWYDIVILLQTAWIVASGKGAF